MANLSVVGQSVYRKDANPKVRGRALHVGNIEMPGMLHVAVLRSPYPQARIVRIDKAKAEALNGVAVVLTGAEIAKMPGIDPHFGPAFRDHAADAAGADPLHRTDAVAAASTACGLPACRRGTAGAGRRYRRQRRYRHWCARSRATRRDPIRAGRAGDATGTGHPRVRPTWTGQRAPHL